MPNFITDNPALVTGLVSALLTLAVALGLPLSQDQKDAILTLAAAIVALAVVAHKTTVPKTPSAEATSASIQTVQPPPPAPPAP
jgi:hypothetical protein